MTKRKGYLLAAAALLCLSGTSLLTSCQKDYDAYSGGYPFSISGDIRSVPS